MVLNLRNIYQPSSKSYNIIARNHRDKAMKFCCPYDASHIDFSRWLDAGEKCTELTITSVYGRTASIQLEDDDDRHLIVSGNIPDGRHVIKVGGSRDFDVRFTGDGKMRLECWDGYDWGSGLGNSLEFVLVPFQQ